VAFQNRSPHCSRQTRTEVGLMCFPFLLDELLLSARSLIVFDQIPSIICNMHRNGGTRISQEMPKRTVQSSEAANFKQRRTSSLPVAAHPERYGPAPACDRTLVAIKFIQSYFKSSMGLHSNKCNNYMYNGQQLSC
jgi:hypothetical protein